MDRVHSQVRGTSWVGKEADLEQPHEAGKDLLLAVRRSIAVALGTVDASALALLTSSDRTAG